MNSNGPGAQSLAVLSMKWVMGIILFKQREREREREMHDKQPHISLEPKKMEVSRRGLCGPHISVPIATNVKCNTTPAKQKHQNQ